MTRRLLCVLAAGIFLMGCADDGPDRLATSDASGSATIIVPTTTQVRPAPPAAVSDATAPITTAPMTTAPMTSTPMTSTPVGSGPSDTAPVTTSGAPPTTVATAPVTLPTMGDPTVATEVVAEFDRPVDLVARPGDTRLFVVEQPGRVVMYDGVANTTLLDISDRVSTGGEQGLLGLAFNPSGTLAYVNYTDTDGTTTIAEFVVAPDATFDLGSEREILTVVQPYGNHNAGDLAFGPDDMLYIGLGHGGSANDPQRRASDPSVLLGSLLRIDPTPSDARPYSIPTDNPFADGPLDGVDGAAEVWAWGLRNPWKFDFDPRTGDLWIADVGQNLLEEVNFVTPTADHPAGWGVDFGWSAFEGTDRFNDDVADTGRMTSPVLTYEHGDDGCSISGGVPYVGAAVPELLGGYVYSDYCSGRLWALDLAGQRNLTLLDGLDSVTAVRTGPDEEIYILQRSGEVLRLVNA